MNDGDILLYLDCGCELSSERKDNLLKYIDLVKIDKLIGRESAICIEKDWNKMDLIEKMNINKDEYLNTAQRGAGANLFLVCHETINLVNEWYNLTGSYSNKHLILYLDGKQIFSDTNVNLPLRDDGLFLFGNYTKQVSLVSFSFYVC